MQLGNIACVYVCDFCSSLWFSALHCANHISPGKLLAVAGGREAGERGDGDERIKQYRGEKRMHM